MRSIRRRSSSAPAPRAIRARRAGRELNGEQASRLETEPDAAEVHEGRDQQSRSDEQDHRQRDFADDERVRQPVASHVDAGAGRGLQHATGIGSQAAERSEEAEARRRATAETSSANASTR